MTVARGVRIIGKEKSWGKDVLSYFLKTVENDEMKCNFEIFCCFEEVKQDIIKPTAETI